MSNTHEHDDTLELAADTFEGKPDTTTDDATDSVFGGQTIHGSLADDPQRAERTAQRLARVMTLEQAAADVTDALAPLVTNGDVAGADLAEVAVRTIVAMHGAIGDWLFRAFRRPTRSNAFDLPADDYGDEAIRARTIEALLAGDTFQIAWQVAIAPHESVSTPDDLVRYVRACERLGVNPSSEVLTRGALNIARAAEADGMTA